MSSVNVLLDRNAPPRTDTFLGHFGQISSRWREELREERDPTRKVSQTG